MGFVLKMLQVKLWKWVTLNISVLIQSFLLREKNIGGDKFSIQIKQSVSDIAKI